MPVSRYIDESYGDQTSTNRSLSDENLSSSDSSRVGRATGTRSPATRSNRASGRQSKGEDNFKAPFNPDKYGVLGRSEQQAFDLLERPDSSSTSRYSLEVDSRMPGRGLRTLDSINYNRGPLKSHLFDAFENAGWAIIEDTFVSAGIGAFLGFATGGPIRAALGFGLGVASATKGVVTGPIQGCLEGCHVFDIKKENQGRTFNVFDKLRKLKNFNNQP